MMSRTAAVRLAEGQRIDKELDALGIIARARGHKGLAEEQPAAYKDVDQVVEVVDRAGISLDRLESFLARAEQLGWVHRVASNRFFLPTTLRELERVAEHLATERPDGAFAAADFNRVSGIGRNLTIQVLEYFDRIGITQRHGDRRSLSHALTRTSRS